MDRILNRRVRPTRLTKALPFIMVSMMFFGYCGYKVHTYITNPHRVFIKALENWDMDNINLAIANGANVDTFTNNTRAISWAFKNSKHDFMKVLTDAGAMVNLVDENDISLVAMAYQKRDTNAFRILGDAGASMQYKADQHGHTVATLAVAKRDTTWLPYILQYADVNKQDIKGRLPLHLADTKDGRLAELLLKHGADPNAEDSNGNTTLAFLKENRTIEQLVRHGADVNKSNVCGIPPIAYHVAEGRYGAYKYLVNNDASLIWQDSFGNNILYYSYLDKKSNLNYYVKTDFKERHPEEWQEIEADLTNTALVGVGTAMAGKAISKFARRTIMRKILSAATGIGIIWEILNIRKLVRDAREVWNTYKEERARKRELEKEMRQLEKTLKEELYKCYTMPV